MKPDPKPPFVPYEKRQFDEGYYSGERGGFKEYIYDSDTQRFELKKKLDCILDRTGIPITSILFIGCAKGFEVRYFREAGYYAAGVDVSEYAIANCEEAAKDYCHLYDGSNLYNSNDKAFQVVASFDVLTLIPAKMMDDLAKEMRRVSEQWIIFRSIVKDWTNLSDQVDGLDGVSFRYKTIDQWVELFERDGDFRLATVLLCGVKREAVFAFKRIGAIP